MVRVMSTLMHFLALLEVVEINSGGGDVGLVQVTICVERNVDESEALRFMVVDDDYEGDGELMIAFEGN
ncbi:hypothetical protein Tco_1403501 [Tanacetum coccineum]